MLNYPKRRSTGTASACGDPALVNVTASAPARSTPLCEGVQDTVVNVRNDATCVLTSNYAVEFSLDNGRSWYHGGHVAPFDRCQFWRASGEQWRMRNVYTNAVPVQKTTNGGTLTMIVTA